MSSFLSGVTSTAQKNLLKFVKHSDKNQNNSDDRNSQEKTAKNILKRIKSNDGALSNLEQAVTCEDSSTGCVTVPR